MNDHAESSSSSSASSVGSNNKTSKPVARSLFDRMGGVPAVRAVIEDFYRRILDDERLSFFFLGAHMGNLKMHQLKFFKLALTEIPKDLDVGAMLLEKHMRLFVHKGLDEMHFDLVVGHLIDTLQHFNVPQDLQDEAIAIVAPLRAIFEKGAQDFGRRSNTTSGDSVSVEGITGTVRPPGLLYSSDEDSEQTPDDQEQAASSLTLTDKLGGPEALKAVVDDLYDHLTSDKTLKFFFRDSDVEALKLHQLYFLQHVTDGNATAEERLDIAVRQSHQRLFRRMGLNEHHFDRLVEHLIITLKKYKVTRPVMDELLTAVGPMREAFVLGKFLSERIII